MNADGLFDLVVDVYRKEYLNLGFIPKSSLYQRYYKTGLIKFIDNHSFIMTGPSRRRLTRIYAIYVDPKHRADHVAHDLVGLLSRDIEYYVRCVDTGISFWKWHGMSVVDVNNHNTRKRDIYKMQGFIR